MAQNMLLISPPPGATITAYMGHMPGTVIYYLMYDTAKQQEITDWCKGLHEEMIMRQAALALAESGVSPC